MVDGDQSVAAPLADKNLIETLEQLVADGVVLGATKIPRSIEHARLLLQCLSGQRDIVKLGLNRQRFDAMIEHRFPLAFQSEAQFLAFHTDLSTILRANGVSGQIRIIGTSTSLFTLNPHKPSDHYFDDDSAGSADLDIGIESLNLSSIMLDHGVKAAESALSPGGSFKEHHLREHLRGLSELLDRWSCELGRPIHIGGPADGQPLRSSSPTDFRLSIAELDPPSAMLAQT